MGLGITNQQLELFISEISCPADILIMGLKHSKFFVLLKGLQFIGFKCTPGLEDFYMTVICHQILEHS